MELKISKEDFDNLKSSEKLKIISLCFDILEFGNSTIVLSNVEIKSKDEFIAWLKGNWGILQEMNKVCLP